MTTPGLTATVLADLRDLQPPVIAGMLMGGCAAKLSRVLRAGSLDAGLGPTELFPLRLRRPLAMLMCAFELCLGLALVVTLFPVGTRQGVPLFAPRAATGARVAAAAFFLVAASALIELRARRPAVGCGCFGDLSTRPVGLRSIARSAVLTVAALTSIDSPAFYLPPRGRGAVLFLGILCAEIAAIAVMSPEVGEALVRLGYSDPCELRRLPAERTLAALRRSRQWRRHAGAITADLPVDMWRELCWRYVAFPYRSAGAGAEVVFAVQVKRRRPAIQSAVVPLPAAAPAEPAPDVAPARGAGRHGALGAAHGALGSGRHGVLGAGRHGAMPLSKAL
ncbi:MAG TPA: MauE/DoxX family redox-associated membrane protein [Streptosporangiaceae bacterium]|nr:MauE/DoxX family redox-associated membrane protein [Streptosporangiaceae bacterium]